MTSRDERFALLELDLPGKRPERPEPEAPADSRLADIAAISETAQVAQGNAIAQRGAVRIAGRAMPTLAERKEAEEHARAVERDNVRVAAARQDLVAGAAAEGHGVIFSWSGSGEMRVGALADMCRAYGLERFAPTSVSAHLLAGRAIRGNTGGALTVKSCKRGKDDTWAAKWILVAINTLGADVGGRIGDVCATVELDNTGEMSAFGDSHWWDVCESIVADYKRACELEIMSASDVTRWLHSTSAALGGVRVGTNAYLPAATRERLEAFVATLSAQWGDNWMLPTPIATSAQLLDGIASGLAREIADFNAAINAMRDQARTRGAEDIGKRAVASKLQDCESLAERVRGFANMIGETRTETLRASLRDLQTKLSGIVDNTTTERGAMLELS